MNHKTIETRCRRRRHRRERKILSDDAFHILRISKNKKQKINRL